MDFWRFLLLQKETSNPGQPWHPESCSYTPSNHLWFLVLTKKKKKPTAFLGCVVQSFLRCRDLFVMFDCSSYCLRGLAPSQRLRHNCCFAHRGFDTLCLTDIQSVGTVLSLCVFTTLTPSAALLCFLAENLLGKQENPLLCKRASSCSAVSKLSA